MNRRAVARVALAIVIAGVIAAIYFSPLRDHLTRDEIRASVATIRGVWYGPIIYIAVYAISCIFALPASLFVIAAGFIWGWKLGGTYALIGGVLGAICSFLAGRFIGEGLLARFGRVGIAVAKQVDHAGFKTLLFLRLIPGIPFAVLNYGAGVAGVRFGDFVLATILGAAPSKYVFAYCADALLNGTMTEGDALKRMVIVAVLILSIVFIPLLLKRFVKPATAE